MQACLSHRIEVVHTGTVYKHELLLRLQPIYRPFITLCTEKYLNGCPQVCF